ncbi:MAG: carboxypeptidase regulatory-like domain-containing protein [Candidatus Eremiobacteraeota bacterium]|nr:carboxypeptidase regulatory-like domain-containing protein [Candidatus Eremiobacteraeota bacterium]
MNKLLTLACALYIFGCGSSDSSQGFGQANGSNGNAVTLSGRAVDENGSPLQGIAIKAQDRTSGQEFAIVSNSDGSFQISAPGGVYDVVLDRAGDSQVATSYYGPIVPNSGTTRDFVLHNRGGRANDAIYGKIELTPGSAAAGRQLNFNPGSARNYQGSVLPDSLTKVTTQADGRFEASLGHADEVALDLEIPDAGGALDEWIRIEKLNKPAYVEVATEQSDVENVLRANENPPSLASTSNTGVKSGAVSNLGLFTPFQLSLESDGGVKLSNGDLTLFFPLTGYTIPLLVTNPATFFNTDFQSDIQTSVVELTPSGAWSRLIGYEGRINITNSIKSNWTFRADGVNKNYLIKVTKTPGSSGCNYGENSENFISIQASPAK